MDSALVIGIALLLPLIHLPLGLRLALWTFIALTPLYMYHKSMFVLVDIANSSIQIPTLTKDLVCYVLFPILVVVIILRSKKEKIPHLGLLAGFTIFGAFLLASSMIQSNSPMKSLMGIRSYLFYPIVGLFVGGFLLRNDNDLKKIVNLLLPGVAIVALIALVHAYIDSNLFILDNFRLIWNGKMVPWPNDVNAIRLHSFFTSPNILGNLMGFGIILGIWKIMNRHYAGPLLPYLLIMVIACFWVLNKTLSRAALLSLITASMLMVTIISGKIPKLFILIIVLAIAGVIAFTPFGERILDKEKIFNNPRLMIWGVFIYASIASWRYFLLGHGVGSVGTFGAEQSFASDIKDPQLALANFGTGTGGTSFVVDNAFVKSLYEVGIVGILVMVLLVGYIVWASFKTMRQGNREIRGNLALPLGVCAFIISLSFFGDMLLTYPWSFIFWISFSYIRRSTLVSEEINETSLL